MLLLRALSIGANLDNYTEKHGTCQTFIEKATLFYHYVDQLNADFRHYSVAPIEYMQTNIDSLKRGLFKETYSPLVEPQSALFGQIKMRKTDPPFYLCTRYLVLQVGTGAMHIFRFKHKHNAGQFYP